MISKSYSTVGVIFVENNIKTPEYPPNLRLEQPAQARRQESKRAIPESESSADNSTPRKEGTVLQPVGFVMGLSMPNCRGTNQHRKKYRGPELVSQRSAQAAGDCADASPNSVWVR